MGDAAKRGRIITGEKVEFEEYTKGLGEFYFENADKYSNNIFQIDGPSGKKETFASIKQRSIRVAINMRKIGVRPNDVVLICSKTTMNSIVPHMSTLYLGAITGGLHHLQSPRDLMNCIKLIQPNFIFVEEECLVKMEKSLEDINLKPKLIVFGKSQKYITFDYLEKPSDEEATFRPVSIEDCKKSAVILFSSGTTGPPKAMCISHYSLINRTISNKLPPNPHQLGLTLIYSTLFWISSIVQILFSFYSGSGKLIPYPEYNAREMLELIEKYKITMMFISPVLLRPVLSIKDVEKYDLLSLRLLAAVGTPLRAKENVQLKQIFKNAFISQGYASSETLTLGTGFNSFKDKKYLHKLDSVGRCQINCQIKVVNPDTREVLGPNETGEICIKTPFMFSGYYNEDFSNAFDKDGFLKMGDLGFYDEDECFFIVGRIKEVFKYRTFQIPTNYLESILVEHPSVSDASVFGIPHPEDYYHPAACIVLKEGTNTNVEEIEEYYLKNVSDWYRLRGGIKVVKELPKTLTDKVQKYKLLDLFNST